MKLTVVGGAGVRAPLLMPALARRQEVIGLDQVVLMDSDERRLSLMAPLARYVAEKAGSSFCLSWTADAQEALEGAGAVITTLRVGGERGRVLDERIALEHGVLGQETTGPGGFAMALRTVPAVASYAEQMRRLCPDAWLLNFTNPAGLVAQALTERFPDLKIVGICDTPTSLHREVAAAYGRRSHEVPMVFFGLNHLSWMWKAMVDGEDVIPRIVSDPKLAARISELSFFDQGLLQLLGMLPNEYLYFYYYREQAVAHIRSAGETRGEQVQRLSAELLRDLEAIGPAQHPQQAWERYSRYLDSRHGSYLAAETGGNKRSREGEKEQPYEEGEGYAGVALDILSAARTGPRRLVANVPNRGTVAGMEEDDVVEVVCEASAEGVHPIPIGEVPADALLLMQAVKRYERLTVDAIRERSRARAVEALLVHPLVGSYSLARGLVDAYLKAHAGDVGEWQE